MSKTTTAKKAAAEKKDRTPRGAEILLYELDQIGVIPNFNVRIDYGDINELARSIEANGIKQPLRGHLDRIEGKIMVTDGHRRLKAIQLLAKKGVKIRVPIISDARDSEEQRVLNMLILNAGKKLNPVEESEVINRLSNYGYPEDEIRDKTGFTKVYICNLKLLNASPKKVKDLILKNIVSATLAMQIFREEKDYTKAQELIENTIISKGYDEEGNKKKITQKDLNKHKGKTNSYSALKKVFNKFGKNQLTPRQDKIDLFNFMKQINDGELSLETLQAELFEPVIDDLRFLSVKPLAFRQGI